MSDTADTTTVLHVDDDPAFTELVATQLEREDERLTVRTATSAADGLALLDDGDVDCVVSDYDMPGQNGIEFLAAVRERHGPLPFVLYTGKGSEEVASEAISAGVTDYLQKGTGSDQYTILANRIGNAVSARRSADEAERRRRRLEETTARLEVLFEDSPDMVNVHDASGSILDPNAKLCEATGYEHDELTGMKVWELDRTLTPAQAANIWEEMAVGDSRRFESTYERRDGSTFPVEVHLKRLDLEGADRFVAISRDVSEQRARERQLERSEHRYRALAGNLPNGAVLVFDTELRYLSADGGLFSRPGVDRETYVGNRVDEVFEGETRATKREMYEATLDGETCQRRVAYEDLVFRVYTIPVRDDGGAVFAGIVMTQDITERVERERKLEQLRERTQELMYTETVEESTGYAVAAADEIIDAPLSGIHLLSDDGSALEAVAVADSVPDVFPDPPRFERGGAPGSRAALVWEAYRSGDPVSVDSLSDSDRVTEESPAESVAVYPLGDHGVFIISSKAPQAFTDTDRLLAEILANNLEATLDRVDREQTLRTRENRLGLLHEATRDLIRADSTREVTERIAEAAEEILGFSLTVVRLYDADEGGLVPVAQTDQVDDVLPERPLYTPDDDSVNWETYESGTVRIIDDIETFDDVADKGTGLRSVMLLPMGEFGTISVGETVPRALDDTDEFLARILATAGETALQSRAQRADLQSRQAALQRQNERLEEFASVISHDLRNPLNVASLNLELVAEECDSEHLDGVERAHDRMAALIEDLLTLAREGQTLSEVTNVELAPLVANCWRSVDTRGTSLVAETDRTIRADQARLRQLFENLFRNAVEHGNPGDGHDAAATGSQDATTDGDGSATDAGLTVTVGDLPDGFYVADDGRGIPESARDQVFETGYSTSADGTGFGLSIAEQVADAHDWSIRVTESEAGGARFEFTGVETATE
ncbi:hybrid sensor histidine kinase/response regulator [Haloarchaeobius iranensis]|uniref:histidine kinase n=1 Tax=Haloarchaeobius iranensis TaxID=996166 RepID=A0A1G9SFW8_9EURY|nr:PAS domain S-box protein [Haloarchaeobius iranensis]SDM34378.1 PAS domain S-box-containing protein [Haloarchaeobius iranensis]